MQSKSAKFQFLALGLTVSTIIGSAEMPGSSRNEKSAHKWNVTGIKKIEDVMTFAALGHHIALNLCS